MCGEQWADGSSNAGICVGKGGSVETGVIACYHQGALTGEDLQAAIDVALLELSADDAELTRLRRNSDDAHEVRFVVVQQGGFIGGGVLLGIAIGAGANLTADTVKVIWTKVLKRVKAIHGSDAVGPEAPGTEPTQKDNDE